MKKNLLALFLLALLSLVAYGNTFRAPFSYDDNNYIVENPAIRSFGHFASPSSVFSLPELTPTYRSSFNTRTLGYLTFAVNYRLNGLDVRGYHLVNLLIHLGNSLLVYFLTLLTLRIGAARHGGRSEGGGEPGGEILVPLLVAALFCVHPICTSAVTYISQRFASLVTFFYLMAFVAFIRFRIGRTAGSRRLWFAVTLVSTVVAMFTKENAFTLPFLLAIYDFIFFRSPWKQLSVHIPLILSSLIVPFNIVRVQRLLAAQSGMGAVHVLGAADNVTPWEYFITQFHVLLTYLRLLLLPVRQRVFYDIPVSRSLLEPPVLCGALLVLFLLAAAFFLWRRGRERDNTDYSLIAFGILWFFATLSIESTFIPNINLLMEYRLYLPLTGFLLAIVPPLVAFAGRRKWVPVAAMAVAVIVLAVAARERNRVWLSNVTLWEDNVAKSPGSAQAEHFLTVAYARSGRSFEAMSHALRALQLRPDYIEVHINLGLIYANLGYYDKALEELETARRLTPSYPPIWEMIRKVREKRDGKEGGDDGRSTGERTGN